MITDAAFQQLLEMGIPGGRARAALMRTKDDVMAAAERVFAGEYDDIPSDDEGDEAGSSGSCGSKAMGIDHPIPERIAQLAARSDDEGAMDGSDEIGEGSDDGQEYDGFIDEDDELHEDRLLSDPYAGIFFSKDRTETFIETVERPVYVNLPNPPGTESAGKKKVSVRILGSGEWMSGCPEGNEQSFLFQLYNKLSSDSMQCSHGCGHTFQRRPEDFFALFPEFPTYLAHIVAIVRPSCPRCSRLTCLACGEKCDQPAKSLDLWTKAKEDDKTAVDSKPVMEIDALLHCVDLQGVLIGVGLHMIEESFSTQSPAGISPSKTPPTKRRRKSVRNIGVGVASLAKKIKQLQHDEDSADDDDMDDDIYDDVMGMSGLTGIKSAAGTGYAGTTSEDRSGQIKAQAAQKEADTKMSTLLAQVQVYLPHLNRASGSRTSDHLVHPTALAHLRRRSGFVSELLRNDSLLDMSNRGDLYRALFDWLEVVSGHEALASMLAMPQMRPTSSHPIPDSPDQRQVTYEGSSSPRELLESVVIQAKAALKGLEATSGGKKQKSDEGMTEDELRVSMEDAMKAEEDRKRELKRDENEILREFCERIVTSANTIDRSLVDTKGKDFVKRMKESLPKLPGNESLANGKEDPIITQTGAGASTEAVMKIYEEWAMKTRFQYADLSLPPATAGKNVSYQHAYNDQILSIQSHSAPKRSLAIAKELAILTTNLPVAWHSTIFLRVDETRVDCIKAMIIGPEGTPYENGCFIFDIFLPLDYNQRCPSVKSMTTNGGKYRYNPNLYADGKVCLSLLGTWSGPGWIAGQSTLLQVLISIQSLILCEEPYCNEPGWASQGGSDQSKAYSANIRRMVLIDAMAGNIKNPPRPFEREIKTHFRLKAGSIRDQLDKWAKLDDGRQVQGEAYGMGLTSSGNTATTLGKTSFNEAADALRQLLDELEDKGSVSGSGAVGGNEEAREEVKPEVPLGKKKKGKTGKAAGK